MHSKLHWRLICGLALLFARAALAQVPGDGHAEARQLLAGGDAAGAVAALAAAKDDAEALVLRGAAHQAAGDLGPAWGDFAAALALLRVGGQGAGELAGFALAGCAQTNGLRTGALAARDEAVATLDKAAAEARDKGDWEVARQCAVAALRLNPLHAGSRALLKAYWEEPALRGCWIHLFDPSMHATEKPEGSWVPLADREGHEFRPNGENVDTAEMLLPVIDAPEDGYQVEVTFELIALNDSKERTVALGVGRGEGSTLVMCVIKGGRIGVYRQEGGTFTVIGDHAATALPSVGRAFTLRMTVQAGKLLVHLDGAEVMTRDDLGKNMTGLPFLITSQNVHGQVWNARFRHRPAGATADEKAVKEAEKAVKKKEPTCLDDVDALLADAPNHIGLLALRAAAAAALAHPDAAMAHRRVLEEDGLDKKVQKDIEKGLKDVAFPSPITAIMATYVEAIEKAAKAAPRAYAAADRRVLELKRNAGAWDKKAEKAWEKIAAGESSQPEWVELPVDPDKCIVQEGTWTVAEGGAEASGSDNTPAQLEIPCTTSDAFEVAVECRMLVAGKQASGFSIAVGEPLLLWTGGFPAMTFALREADKPKDGLPAHIAKMRRDADAQWHTYRVRVEGGFTSLSIDDQALFHAALPAGFENLAGRKLFLRSGPGPIQFRKLRYRDLW